MDREESAIMGNMEQAIMDAVSPVAAIMRAIEADNERKIAEIERLPLWEGMAAPGGGNYLHLIDKGSVIKILKGDNSE